MLVLVWAPAAAVSAVGCALHPLSAGERDQIAEIRQLGLPEVGSASPTRSAVLDAVLPGAGNADLLVTQGDGWQGAVAGPKLFLGAAVWGAALSSPAALLMMPLFFWWWGIPQVAQDAEVINVRASIEYYLRGPGREEYERRKKNRQ
jgi:hypothetical protein